MDMFMPALRAKLLEWYTKYGANSTYEIEARVKVSVKLIKPGDPMHVLPSPTTLGNTTNPLATSPFVSFHGFSNKPSFGTSLVHYFKRSG